MSLSEPTITALSWIPKGAARARPVRFELNSDEYSRIKALADGEEELEKAIANGTAEDDDEDEETDDFNAKGATFEKDAADKEGSDSELPPEFKMDEYDDEDSLDGGAGDVMEDDDIAVMEDGDLAFAMDKDDLDEDEENDNEDDEIRPTDKLLVIAKTEDEYSHLEVLLMAEDGNLYTHHDITLPDMPLCLAWMDCPPYQGDGGGQLSVGNYMAVGTFAPAIEIWNLDVLDPLEPTATLGGIDETRKVTKVSKKTGKKKVKDAYVEGSHTAAVMSLSWNTTYRQALASGSADSAVKLWDVTTQRCSHTFSHHTKEVQSVSFHPAEAWLLATGSYDRTLSLVDCRSGGASVCASLTADIESLHWNPHNPYQLWGSLEDGQVLCVDVRNTSAPQMLFQAHYDGQTVSSLSFSPLIPGMMATASKDKTVKVWDVNTLDSDNQPRCVAYKTMKVGQLFAMAFSGDEPFTLAVGGDKGMVAVWETDEQEVIKNHFESRVQNKPNPYLSINSGSSGELNNGGEMTTLSSQINTTAAELADESWMDDNTGVETGGAPSKKNSSKKDKKDKKKSK